VRLDMIHDVRPGHPDTTRSLGGGWWSPAFRCTFDDPDRPVIAEVDIAIGDDGHPRVVEVTTRLSDRSDEIEPAALRLPLGEIVRAALWIGRFSGPVQAPGARPERGMFLAIDETLGPRPSVPRRRDDEGYMPQRRSYVPRTDERMTEVADVYKRAPSGRKRQSVADYFDVRPNTARNLIREARRRGFIEEPKEDT
jgi:hypothetical protein